MGFALEENGESLTGEEGFSVAMRNGDLVLDGVTSKELKTDETTSSSVDFKLFCRTAISCTPSITVT